MNRNLIIEKANQLIKRDIKDFNKLDVGYKELIQDKYISKVCSEMSFSLVEFESGVLEFAYYKDGMFQYNDKWYLPDEFNGWISINNLKRAINIFSE